MKTNVAMKNPITILILTLLTLFTASSADIYVSPEDHRAFARDGLAKQLANVPAEEQVLFVRDLLNKIPLDRMELERRINEAEAGVGKGTPVYMLRKGFDSINYREEIYKEWLEKYEANPPSEPAKRPEKPQTPAVRTSPSDNSNVTPTSNLAQDPPPSPRNTTTAVAVLLVGSGLLLGLRRALSRGPKS